jgi:hypothetical protein
LTVFSWACASSPSIGADWVRLGQRSVSDRAEVDVLSLEGEGDFKALKILVEGRAVEFHDLKIHFANGTTQDVRVRSVIPAGGESRVIDVVGGDRHIRRVEFVYDAQTRRRGRNGGATVVLFGRR